MPQRKCMKCNDIIQIIEKTYPVSAAEEWDNPGLLVGSRDKEVNKIFVTLDVTDRALDEAVAVGADLIVSHHPLIYTGLKKINTDSFIGRRIIRLIENGISCYAMHTNYDVIGMVRLNEDQLQLKNAEFLEVTGEKDGEPYGLGRVGELPESMTLARTGEYVKTRMQLPAVRCYGDPEAVISRAAVCGGSGKSLVNCAISKGAQVYVTGDFDYHSAIDACAQGLNIIDAGHYGTEICFIEHIAEALKAQLPSCSISKASLEQPFIMI